jgi:hypothetical protein
MSDCRQLSHTLIGVLPEPFPQERQAKWLKVAEVKMENGGDVNHLCHG